MARVNGRDRAQHETDRLRTLTTSPTAAAARQWSRGCKWTIRPKTTRDWIIQLPLTGYWIGASFAPRLFRHRRRRHLQTPQSRQSSPLGASVRDELRFDDRRRPPVPSRRGWTPWGAESHVPLYHWPSLAELALPRGCSLVGVEILDEAADLPSFPHPLQAAYVFGPERGVLTPELAASACACAGIDRPFSPKEN